MNKLVVFCCAWLALFTGNALAMPDDEVLALQWEDLLPSGSSGSGLWGMVGHDSFTPTDLELDWASQDATRSDYNGKLVQLSGFILPLEYDGSDVDIFLLVPYIGACIHVPPPPPNQLVLVTANQPYEFQGLFDPVTVTGMFGANTRSNELAIVGYALSADSIQPYQ